MNYPSSVVVKNSSAEVLARSTVASWLDVDGDRLQDLGEPRGPFTLLAREPMGDGTVMLLADPSLLINGMAEHLDNAVLAGNLLSELGLLRTAVYFDESHRDYFDPLVVTSRLTGEISDTAKLVILGLSFVLLVWVSTDLLDRAVSRVVRSLMALWDRTLHILFPSKEAVRPKRPAGLEGLVEELSRKHPEWRPGIIRHVLREKQRHERPSGPRQS
jgi:hypothetical protein